MLKTTHLFFLLFFLSGFTVFSQDMIQRKPEKNVPILVSEAFKNKFPAKEPIWFSSYQGRYDQKQVYEGRFIFDKRYSSAIYGKEGNMIAFAATIEPSEIPVKVKTYMREQFPNFPVVEALLVTSGKNEVTYELGIFIDGEYIIKVFSEKGDFIKSTRA